MHLSLSKKRQPKSGCRSVYKKPALFRLHPLFLAVGVWYAFKGELFLFVLSTLVAIQHECAHAFAAAKLGYKLNKIVLMPFGAVIDGDMKDISLKDEIYVALCGPLCNLFIAAFFVALWWLTPTMYAFTDTACYSSLSIALLNFLPAYPLDGGRILRCVLERAFLKTQPEPAKAERKAKKICLLITAGFAVLFLGLFAVFCFSGRFHFTMLSFGLFLFFGCFGTSEKDAVYDKIDFSMKNVLKKGVEVRRVAILDTCPIKDAFRFLCRGSYLVLDVYTDGETFAFSLPQNLLHKLFVSARSPYVSIKDAYESFQKTERGL